MKKFFVALVLLIGTSAMAQYPRVRDHWGPHSYTHTERGYGAGWGWGGGYPYQAYDYGYQPQVYGVVPGIVYQAYTPSWHETGYTALDPYGNLVWVRTGYSWY